MPVVGPACTTRSFGFVIHPPSLADVRRAVPAMRLLPDGMVRSLLKRQQPYVVSRVRQVRSVLGTEVDGSFIGCPLLPRQMLDLDPGRVLDRIVASARIAQRLGAGIVGLGGYTSIVGDKGVTVARSVDIAVTSGSSLTAWAAVTALERLAREAGIELSRSRLAVIGATGSIGSLCARKLAGFVPEVVIVARHRERLEELSAELCRASSARVTIETDAHRAVVDADLIITTTSAPDALFGIEELKSGSAVVDVSVPKNISVADNPRDDVRVADGGRVRLAVPPRFSVNLGLPEGVVYACMAETMALTLEGRFESFSLGDRIELARLDEIGAIATRHGFDVWLG
jgi:fatty aldehyde-generating acyl-ACP reductase